MKKFSPPEMKEVSFPTPHTLFQIRRQLFIDSPPQRARSGLPSPLLPTPQPLTPNPHRPI